MPLVEDDERSEHWGISLAISKRGPGPRPLDEQAQLLTSPLPSRGPHSGEKRGMENG